MLYILQHHYYLGALTFRKQINDNRFVNGRNSSVPFSVKYENRFDLAAVVIAWDCGCVTRVYPTGKKTGYTNTVNTITESNGSYRYIEMITLVTCYINVLLKFIFLTS